MKKNKITFSVLISYFIIHSLILDGCKKDNTILGFDKQLQGSELNVVSDSLTLETTTIKENPLLTDKVKLNLLGSYNDPVFGYTSASFYTQFNLGSNTISFGKNAVLDSVVLHLKHINHYGKLTPQNFKIYEITQDINVDNKYYSNDRIGYEKEIGVLHHIPKKINQVENSINSGYSDNSDSKTNATKYENKIGNLSNYTPSSLNVMKIKLSSDFGQKFLNSDSINFTKNGLFIKLFKGLYITTTNANQAVGDGAILYFDLLSPESKITIYYKDKTAKFYDFVINTNCARFNYFEHNYTNSIVGNHLNKEKDTVAYIQPLAGVKTHISFPNLKKFGNKKIAINKAELILPVDENTISEFYTPPIKIFLETTDESGNKKFILDSYFKENLYSDYFGGNYNAEKKEYRFNIGRHINAIIQGTQKDFGLDVIVFEDTENADRVVLRGGNKMKLKIIYTEL